jgi:hypothetical protein
VGCGPGTDRVDADQLDAVAADCEQVTRLDTPAAAVRRRRVGPRRPPARGRRPPRAARRAHAHRAIAVTSTERGTVAASGGVFLGDLALPVETARQSVDVPGGGAELRVRLAGEAWRQVQRALRRRRSPIVRVGVVATDLAGNSREVRPGGSGCAGERRAGRAPLAAEGPGRA